MAQSREAQLMDPGDLAPRDGTSLSKRKRTIMSYREVNDDDDEDDAHYVKEPSSDSEAQAKTNKKRKEKKSVHSFTYQTSSQI